MIGSQTGAWSKVFAPSVFSYAVVCEIWDSGAAYISPNVYKKYIIISIKKGSLGPDTGIPYTQGWCLGHPGILPDSEGGQFVF